MQISSKKEMEQFLNVALKLATVYTLSNTWRRQGAARFKLNL